MNENIKKEMTEYAIARYMLSFSARGKYWVNIVKKFENKYYEELK